MLSQIKEGLLRLLGREGRVETHVPVRRRRSRTDHVILLDGTLSSLEPGRQTNVGLLYDLLRSVPRGAEMSLYYEAGVQWQRWHDTADVAMGRGINRQIRRAYGWLATRYRPGDRVFLFGYSRGAYAVRSLAGIIDQVGLLRADVATERNVMQAYRHYQTVVSAKTAAAFASRFCHPSVEVEMIGVFDTVKALGLRLPLLWMWTEPQHEFHNQALGAAVKRGCHALALDETRAVFDPVLWQTGVGEVSGRVEQVWFRGAHGDVGGQLDGFEPARPLANIPLIWMLERAEASGLVLPGRWREGLVVDPRAPSVGTFRGWGKAFMLRARRQIGRDPSESVHPTARRAVPAVRWWRRRPGWGRGVQPAALDRLPVWQEGGASSGAAGL